MSPEQKFRTIRMLGPVACALALTLAAVAWRHGLWWLVAANCFLAGALADASINAWFVMRTFFRNRQQVMVSGVVSTVWVDPPGTDDSTLAIRRGECPDCGVVGLVEGPCGGMSMNVFCGKCGAKFNAHGGNWGDRRDLSNTFQVDRL